MTHGKSLEPVANLTVQQTGQRFSLKEHSITIGRAEDNDVVIDHSDVSRHHASLAWDGSQFIIEDLGSTNGTFINGTRVVGSHPVKRGDSISLGDLGLSLESETVAGDDMTPLSAPRASRTRVSPAVAAASGDQGKTPWGLIAAGVGVVVVLLLVAGALGGLLWWQIGGQGDEASGVALSTDSGSPVASSVVVVPTNTPSESLPPPCIPDSEFVTDVTIPDYTEVAPGQQINKIWRLRNSGDCPWGTGCQLAFVSGDQMNAAPAQPVPDTLPAGSADIRVTMYAPAAPGTYTGRWRMRDDTGQFFGTTVTVKIVVPASASPTSFPPSTPTETPETPGTVGPLPTPCSAAIDFNADDTSINAGDSTMVRWDVECVREVYLDGAPVAGHGTKQVSPGTTTTYTLHVVKNDLSTEDRQVTVEVSGGLVIPPGGHPPSQDAIMEGLMDRLAASEPRIAEFEFHNYYPSGKRIVFRVTSNPDSSVIQSVRFDIETVDVVMDYCQYAGLNNSFASSISSCRDTDRLLPGETLFICVWPPDECRTDIKYRAKFKFYTEDYGGGKESQTSVWSFTPE